MSTPPPKSSVINDQPSKDQSVAEPQAPSYLATSAKVKPLLVDPAANTAHFLLNESRPQRANKPKKPRVIITDSSLDFEPISADKIPKVAAIAPPIYYRAAIALLKPLYRVMVWKRSRQRGNYSEEVAHRFGKSYPPRPFSRIGQAANKAEIQNRLEQNPSQQNLPPSILAIEQPLMTKPTPSQSLPSGHSVIWCHAVSLGETNTVAPLLDRLMAAGYGIWLTNTTQTGFARGESRFAEQIAAGRLSHSYVPIDSAPVITAFLDHVQPIAAMFVETELWAITLEKLAQAHIPAIMVNARLSASSFASYQKMAKVTSSMMQNLSLIIAQDADSAKRFRQLGAASSKIRVAGSLKWVTTKEQPLPSKVAGTAKSEELHIGLGQRPSWIAASTHAGEESLVLEVHQRLLKLAGLGQTLLLIAPRHPERFDEVAGLIQRSGLTMARRSLGQPIEADTQVYLADTMGELMHWYALADVALVGGSLVDIGGHNPIEPLSVKTPVIMGPFTQSCQQVVDTLISKGALYQLPLTKNSSATVSALSDQLQFWLSDLPAAKQAGQWGYNKVAAQQSVLDRQLAMIETVIHQRSTSTTASWVL